MFIGVNGIQLFYTKTGNGRPLIMVHGNSEDHTIFDEAIGVLKEHFTCYAIDSRGHGKSSPCREMRSTPAGMARAVPAGNSTIRTWLRI